MAKVKIETVAEALGVDISGNGRVFPTVGALANWFGVAERTIFTWKSRGMPTNDDGSYSLSAVLEWRKQQPEPPAWIYTGNPALEPRWASGDLVRDRYQMQREMIVVAIADVMKEVKGDAKLLATLVKHFQRLCLTDEQIENELVRLWYLI